MIKDGYYIKARNIRKSKIAKAPPHIREIWDYLIREANHKDTETCRRGELIRTYKDIIDALSWSIGYRKMTYKKHHCEISMKWLTKEHMITTTKTTRGIHIRLCNYETYQNPKNYENYSENYNKTTRKPQQSRTINKNDKNVKEINTLSAFSKTDNNFEFGKSEENKNCTEFDIKAAKYLEKAVRKLPPRKTGISNAKPSTWANHIRMLRVNDEIEEREIKSTLKWYAQHIGEEYVPEAFSGESFRKKYPAILRQAEKEIPQSVEISPEAQKIVDYLNSLSWPDKAIKNLPAAVQTSLTAYQKWCGDLRKYLKKEIGGEKPTRNVRFVLWLIPMLESPSHFIKWWFMVVNKNVCYLQKWDGNFFHYQFHPKHKRFQDIGRQHAIEFCSDPDRWDELYQEMMKNENQ